MNCASYIRHQDHKPRPIHMNKLQTIMVLIMVCARCSIGQNVRAKTQPYQVFKPIKLLPNSCSNKQKDYQECRKQAYLLYKLDINDYFTATDIFCCFVQKVTQCEEQIVEKCDALEGWDKKNLQQKKNNLFSSCFKKQYSCKTTTDQPSTIKDDNSTLGRIIASIIFILLCVFFSCIITYYCYKGDMLCFKTYKKGVPEPNGETPVSPEPKPSVVTSVSPEPKPSVVTSVLKEPKSSVVTSVLKEPKSSVVTSVLKEPKSSVVTSVLKEPKPSGETLKQSILTETVELPESEKAQESGILMGLAKTISETASGIISSAQKTGEYVASFLKIPAVEPEFATPLKETKKEYDDYDDFDLSLMNEY